MTHSQCEICAGEGRKLVEVAYQCSECGSQICGAHAVVDADACESVCVLCVEADAEDGGE